MKWKIKPTVYPDTRNFTPWRRWFAWYPVAFTEYGVKHAYWLCMIERRFIWRGSAELGYGKTWEYRTKR
ncbi:MAG: hypothetical protein K8U57_27405 [Planctomycetes bacterium]|nr:hypothetical protein [Planctomycetota bacterium]